MFKYRVPDEITIELNKMESSSNLKFNTDASPIQEDIIACSDYEETEDCIIVDGVDVSNCEFFNAKYEGCHCYNTKRECYAINPNEHHSCEGNNCNYKKLKRILSKGSLDNE